MRVTAALVLVLTACGSSTPEPADPADKIERKEAAGKAREVAKEAYASLRRGDVDGFHALVVKDVFVVGFRAADVFSTRSDALVKLAEGYGVDDRHRVTPVGMTIVASPSGKAAWMTDELDIDGDTYRITVVLAEIDDFWQGVALHVGKAGRPFGEPEPLVGGVAPGAEPIVERFRQGAADTEKLLDQFARSKDIVVVGRSDKDSAKGIKAVKKLWKKFVDAHPTLEPEGAVRAALVPDGSLGWVAANVRGGRRVFAVYERGDEGWQLMTLQHSLASK